MLKTPANCVSLDDEMKLLAIETATTVASLVLLDDTGIVAVVEDKIPRKHAEMLPVYYDQLVQKTQLKLADLNGIAISIGPGSFTGLRIGLSFAKGLAYSHGLPLIPVPTLLALTHCLTSKNGLTKIVLYSHRDRIFHQDFNCHSDELISLSDPVPAAWSDIIDQLPEYETLAHYGCDQLLGQYEHTFIEVSPSATSIAELARDHFDVWEVERPFELVPEYISPFETGK